LCWEFHVASQKPNAPAEAFAFYSLMLSYHPRGSQQESLAGFAVIPKANVFDWPEESAPPSFAWSKAVSSLALRDRNDVRSKAASFVTWDGEILETQFPAKVRSRSLTLPL
jgi:hypothetical protein